MVSPVAWNRSHAAVFAAVLLSHLAAILWLLSLRFEGGRPASDERQIWLPVPLRPPPPPPLPREPEAPPSRVAPITAAPLPLPAPDVAAPSPPDWSGTAREVAKGYGAGPTYRRFGEIPQGPPQRPKETYPPSIWPKPLPRVGTTVTTPEGETIIWVSDYCYVSISSRSLTQKEIHDARQGVRTCIFAELGKKKPRDDLFDAIKRPPPPQEPGCGPDGIGQSCGR